jgi:hypothetical protein
MKHEWKEFSTVTPISPPARIARALELRVSSDLEVNRALLALKLVFIQTIAGAITLTFCPQFGVGPWGGGEGVMGVLMQYGHAVCALGCGAAFFALTAWVAVLVLRSVEILALRTRKLWYFPALVAFYIFVGMLVGGVDTFDLEWNLLWGVSALTTLAASYALAARLRLRAQLSEA